ncbi:hypothetical protein N2W52_002062 [Clostridium perfringens]|nr:hypothetical protein [Clostridium perfringens]MDK0983079.1 hypothetical protein [Clostridium perfringens]
MRYVSWSCEIELKDLENGFLIEVESIKGIKTYIAKDNEEVKKVIKDVCNEHKWNYNKFIAIISCFNIEYTIEDLRGLRE